MELLLLDDCFTEGQKSEIYKHFLVDEFDHMLIKNFKDTNLNKYSKINVVLGLKLGFLSKYFLEMVECLQESRDVKIDIILIGKMGDNFNVAIQWLRELKVNYFKNLKVVSELDFEEFFEKLPKIREILTKNEQICENLPKKTVTIYTDGACSGNPGAGGWGAILMHGEKRKEISGFERETTNNRMELTAVIRALEMLKGKCNVELYSDSAYVVNAINNGWLDNWKSNGWVGSDKKQVKNIELWKELDNLLSVYDVTFIKVKGHADNEFNNRCDELATGEIAKNANVD